MSFDVLLYISKEVLKVKHVVIYCLGGLRKVQTFEGAFKICPFFTKMDCANYNPKQHIHHSHNTRVETYIFWVRITCALKAWSLRWLHPMGSSPHEPKDPSLWRIFIQCMKTIYRIYIYIYIYYILINFHKPPFLQKKKKQDQKNQDDYLFSIRPHSRMGDYPPFVFLSWMLWRDQVGWQEGKLLDLYMPCT